MRRASVETVIVFWDEDSQPVGMLHENGKRELYKVKPALKQDVMDMLGAEIPWQAKRGLVPASLEETAPGGETPI
jgi:hypothetical protein